MRKKILSLDFDGVCHRYTTPWAGPTVIADGPVAGLYPFLLAMDKEFIIEIYSTRSETGAGRLAMAGWLRKHAIDYANNAAYTKTELSHLIDVVGRVVFPASKPKAFVGLDDRIMTFEGIWPPLERLLNWKPWNKRTSGKLYVNLECSREDFYDLKELLRKAGHNLGELSMSMTERRKMEAFARLHDQIRDQEFPDV